MFYILYSFVSCLLTLPRVCTKATRHGSVYDAWMYSNIGSRPGHLTNVRDHIHRTVT
jgi:hypothetical protein